MLFDFKREAYLAGRGSIVTEILPDAVKEDIISEGMCNYIVFFINNCHY